MSIEPNALAPSPNCTTTSADLYRALQHHKTDDLGAIRRVLQEQAELCMAVMGTRPHLVDLCSGIGRTVPLYTPAIWSVTCVDNDRAALSAIAQQWENVTVLHADLSRGNVPLDPAHVVVCAHHAANELDDFGRAVDAAAKALLPGGVFYLDLLVGDGQYPMANCRESVRELGIGNGRWLLQTEMIPGARPRYHLLLLIGLSLDDRGVVTRRVVHPVPRHVPTQDEVIARAADRGLKLLRMERAGRFVFRKQ